MTNLPVRSAMRKENRQRVDTPSFKSSAFPDPWKFWISIETYCGQNGYITYKKAQEIFKLKINAVYFIINHFICQRALIVTQLPSGGTGFSLSPELDLFKINNEAHLKKLLDMSEE